MWKKLLVIISTVVLGWAFPIGRAAENKDSAANNSLPKLRMVTVDRIGMLPQPQRSEWESYVARSAAFALQERRILAAELRELGILSSRPAPDNSKEFELDSKMDQAWLKSAEASSLADVVLSWQTPTGGWSKAVDYAAGPRAKGTHWTSQSGEGWHYCGTLDNRSTTEQIRFLALVYNVSQRIEYRDGALRGLEWLLNAQFPNGGWPQVYPLEPGYHEAMTLNDSAMTHAVQVLVQVGEGQTPYKFLDESMRARAAAALTRSIDCLKAAQIRINGQPTVWCAQHDPLNLEPVAARLKEPASLSGGESADLVKYLMREGPDTPVTRQIIAAAVAWLSSHQVTGLKKTKNANGKTDYVADSASTEVLWARFYDLKTQQPIFAGADDGIVYHSFTEMAKNNRVGYDYFTTRPQDVITKEVERWKKRIGAK